MIAVADTSPISYLVLIGEIELLPTLFTEVLIPPGVAAELSDPRAPAPIGAWWEAPPPWIRIADPGPEAVDVVRAVERLRRTNFRVAPELLRDLLQSASRLRFEELLRKIPEVEPDERDHED